MPNSNFLVVEESLDSLAFTMGTPPTLENAGWTRSDDSEWVPDMVSPPSPPPIINDRRGGDAPFIATVNVARSHPYNLERPEPPRISREAEGQYYYEQSLIDLHIAFEPAGYEPANMFCSHCGQWRGWIHTCENELCIDGNLPLAGTRHESAIQWEEQVAQAQARRQNTHTTGLDFGTIEARAAATQRQLSQFAASDSNQIVGDSFGSWGSTMSVGRTIGGSIGVSGSAGVTEW